MAVIAVMLIASMQLAPITPTPAGTSHWRPPARPVPRAPPARAPAAPASQSRLQADHSLLLNFCFMAFVKERAGSVQDTARGETWWQHAQLRKESSHTPLSPAWARHDSGTQAGSGSFDAPLSSSSLEKFDI